MGRKVLDAMGGVKAARGKKATVLGLTLHLNTNDMRDSLSSTIDQALSDAGVEIAAYDPE